MDVNKEDDYVGVHTTDLIKPEKRHREAYFYLRHVLEFVVPLSIRYSRQPKD